MSTGVTRPNSKNPVATETVNRYVARFPNLSTSSLARLIYKENIEVFPTLDSVKTAVRYRRGAQGDRYRNPKTAASIAAKAVTPPHTNSRTNKAVLPDSSAHDFTNFEFDGASSILIGGDFHFPYHSVGAVKAWATYGKKRHADGILLNGDILDLHTISRFEKDPKARSFKEEIAITRQFLEWLREKFPKARIVYKLGNHDERLWKFMCQRVPELMGSERFKEATSLRALLGLDDLGIEFVEDGRIVMLGHLPVLHGHEFRAGFAPPVNPARGAFLKAKGIVAVSHHHRTSSHTETTLMRETIATWSIACLCDLRPKYDPYNGWNNGFAHTQISEGGAFNFTNLRVDEDGSVRQG